MFMPCLLSVLKADVISILDYSKLGDLYSGIPLICCFYNLNSWPYLSSVSTKSNVQVRSPINSKSIDAWKNYKDMLKPAIEILIKTNKYRDITS